MKANELDPFIESLVLSVKTRLEIAIEYGTCVKTLKRKLEKKGIVLSPGIFSRIRAKKSTML